VIVDAHHHVWDPAARRHAWLDGIPALNRRFGLADFERAAAPAGVAASVLVQVLASAAETKEFLELAARSSPAPPPSPPQHPSPAPGMVAGVVGWTDLTSPAVAGEIGRLRARPGGTAWSGSGT
jgi:L-fuconolactonase